MADGALLARPGLSEQTTTRKRHGRPRGANVSQLKRGLCAAAFICVAGYAHAGAILDSGTLQTTDQSMWSSGAAPVLRNETFLGVKWGTYAGEPAETLSANLITGSAETPVPGTGGTIPNPAYFAWQAAMATCQATGTSFNTCVNGTPPVKVCAPSWLGGGCTTIVPAIPGLGPQPPAEIDNPIDAQFIDTRTGVAATLRTSGEAGIVPWVDASGGAIDVALPFSAVLSMPDEVQSGVAFTLSTSATIDGTTISANAPSFRAGVDGVLNIDNSLSGTACVILAGCQSGSTNDLDLLAGRFGVLSIDTTENNFLRIGGDAYGENSLGVPGLALGNQYEFYVPAPDNPDGVDDPTTPKNIPTPRLGDFTVSGLEDFTGGTIAGGTVSLDTFQTLLSLNMSLTGMAETAMASPGVLANKISLIPLLLSVEYSLLDVAVGPRFGIQQGFDFTPNLSVELQFDRPVTRIDASGSTRYDDGIIKVALGSSPQLMFEGEVGQLIRRTYLLDDPLFSNLTKVTIDPGISIELGCFSISIVFPQQCVFNEDFQTEGLLGIPVVDDSWILGGFNTLDFFGPLNPGQLPPIDGGSTPVPEPASSWLLGIGIALLAGIRLRRRAATANT
jgi:PEP-CTERM motif-containing protein